MKQLYGRTNKRDATSQIGKRIRRLERAQLSAKLQRKKMKRRSKVPDIDIDEGMRMNLDMRYEVPNSWKDTVDIYSFVRTHREDPAITVSLLYEL